MISSLVPADEDNVLNRRTSGESAALYIRRLIFDGELKPGSRLPQDEIAARMGISRIPLREGIVALETEGWLKVEIHKVVFVNGIDPKSVADHFEILGMLYEYAIEQAIEHWDEAAIEQMERLEAQLKTTKNPNEAGRLLFGLFVALVDAAQSNRLKVILRGISSMVPGDFFSAVPDAIEYERRAWSKIIRALRQGERDRASDEFLRMMHRVSGEVQDIFRERGLFETVPPD
jgi:DNA-binding GntR family transcriptional regulator